MTTLFTRVATAAASAALACAAFTPAVSAQTTPATSDTSMSEEMMVSVEQRKDAISKYLAAVLDGSQAQHVPFAANCVRYENGFQTGFSGENIRQDLARHLQYAVISDIKVQSWTVAPAGKPADVINVVFDLNTTLGISARVNEDFTVSSDTGEIERITATIALLGPLGSAS